MALSSNISRLAAAALIASLVVPSASAQSPAAQQPQQEYTFRSTSELVLVNVVARDKNGALVHGLTADDFTVTEDGKQQRVASFDFENTELAVLPPPVDAASPAAVAPQQAIINDPAKKEVSLNNRRLVVLFFDFSGMEQEEIERAVVSAQKYVDKQMTAADLVAIASFVSELQIDQDFTTDRSLLKRKLGRYIGQRGEGFEAAADSTTRDENTFVADDSEFNTFNTDRKLQALASLSSVLARIEQKKSIIYFSNGVNRNGLENQAQLRATVNAAVKANVAIYTLDLRGLQALPPGGDASQGSQRGTAVFSGAAFRNQLDSNFASQETLSTLATDTGGRAFLDSNDFNGVFARVQQDTSAYYVLGYRSANAAKDGKYRRIQVKTKRSGLKLDFRKGYYANRDFAHSNKEDREQQIERELNSDLPVTDVGVYLSASYFRVRDDQFFVAVSLIVPGNDIPFTRKENQDRATLDIIGIVRERQSKMTIANARETVKLNIQEAQDVKRKNVQYNTGFLLTSGHFTIKFVVRENQTGRIGSFETNFTVPELRDPKLKNTLKLSSVLLGSQVREAKKSRGENPLIRDGKELVPNITHVFANDQHLYLHYEVYDAARLSYKPPTEPADSKKRKEGIRLLSSLQFFQGKTKAYETPLLEMRDLTDPGRQAAAFQLDVPLSQLKPGLYTCQLNVVDDAAGTFQFPRFALLVK